MTESMVLFAFSCHVLFKLMSLRHPGLKAHSAHA